MGRRSINTTKSGKYMNPTDQARKEARKKELKKNKRQRQMVRAAVLKNKDPAQILEEMEKIDEMEYNVLQPSPLNEKVLRDKRKKLKETFDRVMRLYHNDEPEHWSELKRKESEYEKRRLKKQQYYESVKHAQSVQVDEIPLPAPASSGPLTSTSFSSSSSSAAGGNSTATGTAPVGIRIPPPPISLALPPFAPCAPPGIIRNKGDDNSPTPKSQEKSEAELIKEREMLGVPPGPPPNLFEMSDLDTDAEDDEVVLKPYSPQRKSPSRKPSNAPSSLQQRMLAISGQNIDEFMKEMENVHKKKHRTKSTHSDDVDDDDDDDENDSASEAKSTKSNNENSDSESESERSDSSDTKSSYKKAKRRFKESPTEGATSTSGTATAAKRDIPPPPTPTPTTIPLPPTVAAAASTILPAHGVTLAAPPMPSTVPPMPLPPVHGIAPPPPMLFRPPPMRPPGAVMPNFGLRMPPGPPPGPRQHAMGGGVIQQRMGIRMPPGPPPGMPPRMAHHLKTQHAQVNPQQQIHQLTHPKEQGSKGVTTITAKPQIRNLSADVTRFVPSTLRVKREETRKPTRPKSYVDERHAHGAAGADAKKTTTKDDAYMQFMNEMQGLL